MANRLTIRTNCPTNSLFLRLFAANLERAKALIRDYLDVPLPQVKIEARMEILDRTALEAIGVQWGGGGAANTGKATFVGQGFGQPNTGGGIPPSNFSPTNPNLIGALNSLLPISPITGLPTGGNVVNLPIGALANAASAVPTAGFAFGIVGSNFNINLALQALNEMGKTQTLARPEIVTVENNKASIALGQEIPYATVSSAGTQIQFKEALLKLEVTPTVIREKIGGRDSTKIKMTVMVENNDPGQNISLGVGVRGAGHQQAQSGDAGADERGGAPRHRGGDAGGELERRPQGPHLGRHPGARLALQVQGRFSTKGRELVIFVTPSVLKQMVAAPVLGK